MPAHRVLSVVLAAVALAAAVGCSTTELSGREVLRVGPLRGAAVRPTATATDSVALDAGADALTDRELSALSARLPAHFDARLQAYAGRYGAGARPLGTARVLRCRLRAGAGRRHTIYQARCRVALTAEGVTLAEVEVEALRKAPPRAVSAGEAERVRKLVRNPLLSVADSEAALQSALDHAARLLVEGAPVTQADADADAPALDTALLRRAARGQATREGEADRIAAAADLMRWGAVEDAAALLPLLDDARPRVRRAAALALSELVAKESLSALRAREADEDTAVRAFVKLALDRLYALYPELRDDGSEGASNRSTPGGRDEAATP